MTEQANKAISPEANIMTAVKVLREAQVSVSSLLTLLDERFAKLGYLPAHPTSSKWVGLLQNGAQLGSTANWTATVLHRGYLTSPEPTRNALVIDVDLAPERHPAPVLSILALRFAAPVASTEFWKSWTWEAATNWHGGELDTNRQVEEDALVALFRKRQARGVGRIVALCQLDRQNLERLVINPAMKCVRLVQSLDENVPVSL